MSVSQQHIRRAWKALEKYTPMRKDCGVICASACCKGEADIGMRLVPGEKALLTSDDFTLKTGRAENSVSAAAIANVICVHWPAGSFHIFPYQSSFAPVAMPYAQCRTHALWACVHCCEMKLWKLTGVSFTQYIAPGGSF